MTRTRAYALIIATLALLFAGSSAASATNGEHGGGHTPVTICHNGHEITVDDDAVPAHLAHGDNVGACAPCPEPSVTPTDDPTTPPADDPTDEPTPTDTPTTPTDDPTDTTSPDLTPIDEPLVEDVPAPAPVEVAAPAPVVEVGTVARTTTAPALAETGFPVGVGILVALILVVAGVTLVAIRRRA